MDPDLEFSFAQSSIIKDVTDAYILILPTNKEIMESVCYTTTEYCRDHEQF